MTFRTLLFLLAGSLIANHAMAQGRLADGDASIFPLPANIHQIIREARNSPVTSIGLSGGPLLQNGSVNWTFVDLRGAEAIVGELDKGGTERHFERHRPYAIEERTTVNQLLNLFEDGFISQEVFQWFVEQAKIDRSTKMKAEMERGYSAEQLERASQYAVDAAIARHGLEETIFASMSQTGRMRRLTNADREKIRELIEEARKELEDKVRKLREEHWEALMDKTADEIKSEMVSVELKQDLVKLNLLQEVQLRFQEMEVRPTAEERKKVNDDAKIQDRELLAKVMALRSDTWKELLPKISAVTGFDVPNVFSLNHRAE